MAEAQKIEGAFFARIFLVDVRSFFFSIAEKVHETMHVAFWNILKEDLAAYPPSYEHLLQLIDEAKEVCFCRFPNKFLLCK